VEPTVSRAKPMRLSVYLPLALSIVLAVLSPWVAQRLPPRAATRTLTAAAAAAGAAGVWSLSLLAASAVGWLPQWPGDAEISRLRWIRSDPIPPWAGALAAAALLVSAVQLIRTARRQHLDLRAAEQLCQSAPDTELLIVPGEHPSAIAVPSRDGGRIMVTAAMLHALSATERRVMFAHERAHLQHRHHRYRRIAALAAAVNPLLLRVRNDVAYTCERWADEEAGLACGDRRLAAQALARAAVAAARRPGTALAFERLNVLARVQALRLPPPKNWPAMIAVCAVIAATAAAAAGDATIAFARFLAAVTPAVQELARNLGL
jgi:Zn-dependent protease with chaperone function